MSHSTQNLSLYFSKYCYFCQKVLSSLGQFSHEIELRSTSDAAHHRDLINGGGRGQVPCLRVEKEDGQVNWMYESDDIITYLKNLAS